MSSRFSAWLQAQLDREDLNYTSLAQLVGVQPNSARAWAIGQSEPSPENCLTIARRFHVEPEYLYRLLGWLPEAKESLPESKKRLINRIMEIPPQYDAFCEGLIQLLEELPELPEVPDHAGNREGESSR